MSTKKYHEKKIREKNWYQQQILGRRNDIFSQLFHSKLFFSPKRTKYNFSFAKKQMYLFCQQHLNNRKLSKLLIAPCGTGDDFRYFKDFSEIIYGIDLSPIPLKKCPSSMQVKEGDILKSGYPNEFFDFIASPLFFHHILSIGFEHFLNEFYRILKPGGYLVILEPSIFYPLNAFTRPLKKITKNIYGEIEDEGPFNPSLLENSLKSVGFVNLEVRPATFSHVGFYIPLAKMINWFSKPFLKSDKIWK